jgi:hypothetical protein
MPARESHWIVPKYVRASSGRLRTNIGNVSSLDHAVAVFNRTGRRKGKTIIRVRP